MKIISHCYSIIQEDFSYIMSIKIGVIGNVSVTKSSFINAIANGFIANVSLQRETIKPTEYFFSKNVKNNICHLLAEKLETQHIQNEKDRKNIIQSETNIDQSNTIDNPIYSDLLESDFSIIDFPGLNDSEDSNNSFLELFKKHVDQLKVIIYMTDATDFLIKEFGLARYKHIIHSITIDTENKPLEHLFFDLDNTFPDLIEIAKFNEEYKNKLKK